MHRESGKFKEALSSYSEALQKLLDLDKGKKTSARETYWKAVAKVLNVKKKLQQYDDLIEKGTEFKRVLAESYAPHEAEFQEFLSFWFGCILEKVEIYFKKEEGTKKIA